MLSWPLANEVRKGWLDVAITLAPTMPPRVQYLRVQPIIPPGDEMSKAIDVTLRLMSEWDAKTATSLAAPALDVERLRRQVTAASAWGTCKVGEAVAGDGNLESAKASLERGPLLLDSRSILKLPLTI